MLEQPKPEYWTHFQPPATTPVENGWYPVLRVFEAGDGAYPDAAQWVPGKWEWASLYVVAFGPRQESMLEAMRAAVENDPGW